MRRACPGSTCPCLWGVTAEWPRVRGAEIARGGAAHDSQAVDVMAAPLRPGREHTQRPESCGKEARRLTNTPARNTAAVPPGNKASPAERRHTIFHARATHLGRAPPPAAAPPQRRSAQTCGTPAEDKGTHEGTGWAAARRGAASAVRLTPPLAAMVSTYTRTRTRAHAQAHSSRHRGGGAPAAVSSRDRPSRPLPPP